MAEIHSIRKEYTLLALDSKNVVSNPIDQFKKWFDEALTSKVLEPNAMTLSTVSADGLPHARIVLLKDIVADGFTFYTNYESNKGEQLKENPNASLLFFWPELERQVRIEGKVEKVSREISGTYFHSRPRSSQIGAHTSPQSKAIPDRIFLDNRNELFEKEFEGKEVPLPEFWGGYKLTPTLIEFWQGRPSRLHDRIQYKLDSTNWNINRLAP